MNIIIEKCVINQLHIIVCLAGPARDFVFVKKLVCSRVSIYNIFKYVIKKYLNSFVASHGIYKKKLRLA